MRVRRRGFIGALGGAATWPLAGYAQQPERVRRVGALLPYDANDPVTQRLVTAFAHGLGASAWVEGKDIRIEYRFAAGDPTLFETYAAELVGLSPDAILASTTPAVAAVQQKTRTIPIVFVLVVDPIGQGFVQSLARPGTTSRDSASTKTRSSENGCNCSRKSRQASRGSPSSSTPTRRLSLHCSTARSWPPPHLSG